MEKEKVPSSLKEAVFVTEELEAASTEPGCVKVVTGNDKLPHEFQSEVSSDEANDYDHSYFIRSPHRRLRRN